MLPLVTLGLALDKPSLIQPKHSSPSAVSVSRRFSDVDVERAAAVYAARASTDAWRLADLQYARAADREHKRVREFTGGIDPLACGTN